MLGFIELVFLKMKVVLFPFFFARYPVILSLENHCTLPNQQKMAQILEEILGGILCAN